MKSSQEEQLCQIDQININFGLKSVELKSNYMHNKSKIALAVCLTTRDNQLIVMGAKTKPEAESYVAHAKNLIAAKEKEDADPKKREEREQMIQEIYKNIGEGNKRIAESQDEKAILLLGKTGAGKSTLAYYLSGGKLSAKQNEEGNFVIEADEQISDVIISHLQKSETKIPNHIKTGKGLTIWDCPGSNDTGGIVQEISNAFYIQRLFGANQFLKFILVVSEHSLFNRGQDFVSILDDFVRLFSKPFLENLGSSVSLIVTQVLPTKKLEHILLSLNNILTQNNTISPEAKRIMGCMLKSTHIFNSPSKEGSLEIGVDLLMKIEQSINYLKTETNSANVIISRKSIDVAQELFQTSQDTLFKLLFQVIEKIQLNFQKGSTNQYIKELSLEIKLPQHLKNHIPRLFKSESFVTKTHFQTLLELDELTRFSDFCLEIANLKVNKEFLSFTASNINRLFAILATKVPDDGALVELLKLNEIVSERIEYVKFLLATCDQFNIDIKRFQKLFSDVQPSILTSIEGMLKSMQVSSDEEEIDYYNVILFIFTRYPEKPDYHKVKARVFLGLANIYEKQKNNEFAINCYSKVAKLDKTIQQSWERLSFICAQDHRQLGNIDQTLLIDLHHHNKQTYATWVTIFSTKVNSFLFEGNTLQKYQNQPLHMLEVSYLEDIQKFLQKIKLICEPHSGGLFGSKKTALKQGTTAAAFLDFLDDLIELLKFNCPSSEELVVIQNSLNQTGRLLLSLSERTGIPFFNKEDLCFFVELENLEQFFTNKLLSINIVRTETKMEYFLRISQLLDSINNKNSKKNSTITGVKSLCCFLVGKVLESEHRYKESVAYYVEALHQDNNSYLALNSLFEIYNMNSQLVEVNDPVILNIMLSHAISQFHEYILSEYKNTLNGFLIEEKDYQKYEALEEGIRKEAYFEDWKSVYTMSRGLTRLAGTPFSDIYLKNILQICELLSKNSSKSFGLIIILQTIASKGQWILHLVKLTDQPESVKVRPEWVNFFDIKQIEPAIRHFIQHGQPKMDQEDANYYKRLLKYFSLGPGFDGINAQIWTLINQCMARCYFSIGKIYESANNYQEAMSHYKRSFEFDKSFVDSYERAGDICKTILKDPIQAFNCYKESNFLKCKILLKELIKGNPEDPYYREIKGDYFVSLGLIEKGLESLYEAKSLTKRDAQTLGRIESKIINALKARKA